jgi:hypothetical protein
LFARERVNNLPQANVALDPEQRKVYHDKFVATTETSATYIFKAVEQLRSGHIGDATSSNSLARQQWTPHDEARDFLLYGPQEEQKTYRRPTRQRATPKYSLTSQEELLQKLHEAARQVSGDVTRAAAHPTKEREQEALTRDVILAVKALKEAGDTKITVPPTLLNPQPPQAGAPAQLDPAQLGHSSPGDVSSVTTNHALPSGMMHGGAPGPAPSRAIDARTWAVIYTFDLWRAFERNIPRRARLEKAEAQWLSLQKGRAQAKAAERELPPESTAVALAEKAYEEMRANSDKAGDPAFLATTRDTLRQAQAAWAAEHGDPKDTRMDPLPGNGAKSGRRPSRVRGRSRSG